MGLVRALEPEIAKLMDDSDHFVRVEVANALAMCDTPSARQLLRQALLDRSVMVQEAAESALQQLAPAARQAESAAEQQTDALAQMSDAEIEGMSLPPAPHTDPPQQEQPQ